MPVAIGQADIQENQVGLALAKLSKAVFRRRGLIDVVFGGVEDLSENVPDLRVVVDDRGSAPPQSQRESSIHRRTELRGIRSRVPPGSATPTPVI